MVIAVQSDTGGSDPGFTCKKTQGQTEASCFVQKDDAGTSKYYVDLAPNASTDDKYSCDGVKIQGTTAQGTACCTPGTSPKKADPEKDPQSHPQSPLSVLRWTLWRQCVGRIRCHFNIEKR
ncbi:hypothetical protein PGT21_028965 [Puccinia graminis f. sp. tritici]|uniref:Uncharacterized protein n=1 Tax=Puccinia graminis f. sp. tritici TaxID=56615 RepID=A0A5B0QUR8_PUCGR|nr:hypothetical protein PGT21_028965 [Puccinia graminis f. sp. tritici]KAA1116910.1 hypothetical protein PGTUg99_029930 [Puccinia graminis f. sp. tritici]